jgi:hypothetical protein
MMIRTVQDARAPIFFIQAKNDYDLSPTRALSAAMDKAAKEFEVTIYPTFGSSVQEGHSFGYFGSSVRANGAPRGCGQGGKSTEAAI